jgi:hypothetical protein
MGNGLLLTKKSWNKLPALTGIIIRLMGARRQRWHAFAVQSVTYLQNNESDGDYVDSSG